MTSTQPQTNDKTSYELSQKIARLLNQDFSDSEVVSHLEGVDKTDLIAVIRYLMQAAWALPYQKV